MATVIDLNNITVQDAIDQGILTERPEYSPKVITNSGINRDEVEYDDEDDN